MLRWAVCWLLCISMVTIAVAWWTNATVGSPRAETATPLFVGLPLDQPAAQLGSPECARATRALVAAGDGSTFDANAQQRARFERAERGVLIACGAA